MRFTQIIIHDCIELSEESIIEVHKGLNIRIRIGRKSKIPGKYEIIRTGLFKLEFGMTALARKCSSFSQKAESLKAIE